MTGHQFKISLASLAAFAAGAMLVGSLRFAMSLGAVALQILPWLLGCYLLMLIATAGVPKSARAIAGFFFTLAFAWEHWGEWVREDMARARRSA